MAENETETENVTLTIDEGAIYLMMAAFAIGKEVGEGKIEPFEMKELALRSVDRIQNGAPA